MDRLLPLAGSFLVAVCVFAWLGGPVLETRFGAEALLTAYAAVAVGSGAVTYAVFRRIDARLSDSTTATNDDPDSANEARSDGSGSSPTRAGSAPAADAEPSGERRGEAERTDGDTDSEGTDGRANVSDHGGSDASGRPGRSGSLAELEALSIAAEVERLKEDRDRSE